jgi:hypothetical protein
MRWQPVVGALLAATAVCGSSSSSDAVFIQSLFEAGASSGPKGARVWGAAGAEQGPFAVGVLSGFGGLAARETLLRPPPTQRLRICITISVRGGGV